MIFTHECVPVPHNWLLTSWSRSNQFQLVVFRRRRVKEAGDELRDANIHTTSRGWLDDWVCFQTVMMIWLCAASQKVAETSSRRRSQWRSGRRWLYMLPGIQHSESSHCALKCNLIFRKKKKRAPCLTFGGEYRAAVAADGEECLNQQSQTACHAIRSYHKKKKCHCWSLSLSAWVSPRSVN